MRPKLFSPQTKSKDQGPIRNKARVEDQRDTNFILDSLQYLCRGCLGHEVNDGFPMFDQLSTYDWDLP